ncbi:hypothetical protein BJX66DRAFT_297724, partial [Aspergillus keveii]
MRRTAAGPRGRCVGRRFRSSWRSDWQPRILSEKSDQKSRAKRGGDKQSKGKRASRIKKR